MCGFSAYVAFNKAINGQTYIEHENVIAIASPVSDIWLAMDRQTDRHIRQIDRQAHKQTDS